ncbi:Uncharacterised protein [Klebsiella pneumoniae]|uniref:Uncharacterized protein n=1 Tax=Klebsiella pneumoniae TaxID=573 RepID=A0A447RUG4_KLEPN|nr:Uncharacterised protein [Klebsiella pneumoniae]
MIKYLSLYERMKKRLFLRNELKEHNKHLG